MRCKNEELAYPDKTVYYIILLTCMPSYHSTDNKDSGIRYIFLDKMKGMNEQSEEEANLSDEKEKYAIYKVNKAKARKNPHRQNRSPQTSYCQGIIIVWSKKEQSYVIAS